MTETVAGLRCARVRRPHGVRGETRVLPLGGRSDRFTPGLVVSCEGSDRRLVVSAARGLPDGDVLVTFEGVEDREAAQELAGRYLLAEVADVPELGADEWLVNQLIGLEAVTPDGVILGPVADVEAYPANDVLVVRGASGEVRFPMARAFVRSVDLAGGRIVITPWEEA